MLRKGPEALDDEELLAILLGTGTAARPVLETARDLLKDGGFPGLFARGARDLESLAVGVGPAKATRIEAVLEIARRLSQDSLSKKNLLSDPSSVVGYLTARLARETQEVMGGLLLDAKNRLVKDAPDLPRHRVARVRRARAALPPGDPCGRGGRDPVPQPPFGRPRAVARRRRDDEAFRRGGPGDRHRGEGPRDRGARPVRLVPRAGAPALKETA